MSVNNACGNHGSRSLWSCLDEFDVISNIEKAWGDQISTNANSAVDAVRDGIEGAGNAIKDAGAKIQEKIDDARGKA